MAHVLSHLGQKELLHEDSNLLAFLGEWPAPLVGSLWWNCLIIPTLCLINLLAFRTFFGSSRDRLVLAAESMIFMCVEFHGPGIV